MGNVKDMDFKRDFIQQLRKYDLLDEPHIMLGGDITSNLKKYIICLNDIKFLDGQYHTYYCEIHKLTVGLITYWNQTIDDVIIETDHHKNVMDREKLLELVNQTLTVQIHMQINFCNDFLPVNGHADKQIFDQIQNMYNKYMKKLHELRQIIEKLDNSEKVNEFCKNHFDIGIKNKSTIFNFVHDFLGNIYDYFSPRIKISLEEIHKRLNKNLFKLRANCDEEHKNLHMKLYNKNRELLNVCRREQRTSVEHIEINQSIENIRQHLSDYEQYSPVAQVSEEVLHWEKRLKDFTEITSIMKKLRDEEQNVLKQEEKYDSISCEELSGIQRECWETMGKNIENHKQFIQKRIKETQKCFVTFFSLRQVYNCMIYGPNEIGSYVLCEYGHHVYVFDSGLRKCHLTCDGELTEYAPKNKHYYDENGRYYIDDKGNKVYQIAPCTSCYQIAEDMLMHKVTKDCGHSETPNKSCKMQVERISEELLPDVLPVNMKNTLDPESVKYLWDSFGSILHNALYDVAKAQPKNPIHLLAHKLLLHKYNKTLTEYRKKIKEAQEYRAHIMNKKKEDEIKASKAWKSKQVKRRKPEESDDANEWAAYDHHIAGTQMISDMNYNFWF